MKRKLIEDDFHQPLPGSVLPPVECQVLKGLLHSLRFLPLQSLLSRRLQAETARSIALTAGLSEGEARQRVLVTRQTGQEDGCRYWSANMVLQHLTTFQRNARQLAEVLASGRSVEHALSVARVKPTVDAGPEQQELLQSAVDDYLALIGQLGDLRRTGRHQHPWFGSLDLNSWHAFSTLHAIVHRRQIEQIVNLLKPGH